MNSLWYRIPKPQHKQHFLPTRSNPRNTDYASKDSSWQSPIPTEHPKPPKPTNPNSNLLTLNKTHRPSLVHNQTAMISVNGLMNGSLSPTSRAKNQQSGPHYGHAPSLNGSTLSNEEHDEAFKGNIYFMKFEHCLKEFNSLYLLKILHRPDQQMKMPDKIQGSLCLSRNRAPRWRCFVFGGSWRGKTMGGPHVEIKKGYIHDAKSRFQKGKGLFFWIRADRVKMLVLVDSLFLFGGTTQDLLASTDPFRFLFISGTSYSY